MSSLKTTTTVGTESRSATPRKERREGRSELLKITADSLDSGLTRISYQKEIFRTDAQPFVCGLRFRQGDPEEQSKRRIRRFILGFLKD